LRHLLILTALVVAAPASAAEYLPVVEQIVSPEEKPLLQSLLQAVAKAERGEDALNELNQLLGKLQRPTPFRGFVQFIRAGILSEDVGKEAEARAAIIESIRLLPQYGAPLILGAEIEAYGDRPGLAADYLLRASQIDPETVNQIDGYEINNVFMRLRQVNDDRRSAKLAERLVEIGWSNGSFTLVSSMAMEVLEARLSRGDVDGAARMLPKIVTPAAFARLQRENRFDVLRAAVEAWAGSNFEKIWPIYLDQAQAEWEASHDPATAGAYAGALAAAGHDATLIRTFLPVFNRKLDAAGDFELIFVVPIVANALSRQGRWDDAYGLYEKALGIWPVGQSASSINLTGNRAKLRLTQGEFRLALRELDEVIQDAKRWGGHVSASTLASIHTYRACALEQLGRGREDISSVAVVTGWKRSSPTTMVYLQLCKNDLAGARTTLLEAIESEATRDDVIAFMQPTDERVQDSAFARLMASRFAQLRADKALLEATRKYGRIRIQPINVGAPPEAGER